MLEDFDEYQEKNRVIETFEDVVLGYLADESYTKSKKSDFMSAQEVAKKLGIPL